MIFNFISVITNSVVSGCGGAAYTIVGDPCSDSSGHVPNGRSTGNEARCSMYGILIERHTCIVKGEGNNP